MGARTEDGAASTGRRPSPTVGDTPWIGRPARGLRHERRRTGAGLPPGDRYADSLPGDGRLDRAAARADGTGVRRIPRWPRNYGDLFDYAAEDAWLAGAEAAP